ncbi:ARM repeat-containing protein, partial [Suhomyces tanzawaensis NRRL Y-17324]
SNPSPPSISLTPSNESPAIRSRSRAGTLPSSFLSTNASVLSGGASSNNSPLVSGQYDVAGLSNMDPFSLGLPAASGSSNAIDIPNGSSSINGGNAAVRRMRSGSFFSTNSIWNDDVTQSPNQNANLLDNTSLHSFDNSNFNAASNSSSSSTFLSPNLTAQSSTQLSNVLAPTGPNCGGANVGANQRNRSYTTTAAPNVSVLPMSNNYNNVDSFQANRMSTSPFINASNKTNDMNSLLDNLMFNMNSTGGASNPPNARLRSQTFSGSTPTIAESSLQQPFLAQGMYQKHVQQNPLHVQHPTPSQQQPINNIQQLPQHQPSQASQFNQQGVTHPSLFDDFDFSQMVITTNFENPNLGPTKFLLFDNIPQFIDSLKLYQILNNTLGNRRSLGSIRGIRVATTTSSKLALVECSSVDIAMTLKASFNHLELVPGVILYVAFAKFADSNPHPEPVAKAAPTSNGSAHNSNSNGGSSNSGSTKSNVVLAETTKVTATDLLSVQESLTQTVRKLTMRSKYIDINKIVSIVNKSISYSNDNYQNNFGPLPDPIPLRQFDSPKLRELRKILENNENALATGSPYNDRTPPATNNDSDSDSADIATKVMTQVELEELCLAMLDELPELCYDYLGNTIVQKIFTLVDSPLIKLMMVKEIAPFLTQLSIHKNGTWAIQKIINLCQKDFQQMYLIGASLKPYAVKLFNDQFGNYVLQGCIKFGSPFNDFIFETMLDNFLEISFGRFGARCIRTILETANETNDITNEQVLLVAGLIVEFANELVVNNNGSLLITWFLDTFNDNGSTVDDRFQLLTAKFLPKLLQLCTHKLANLTILKILNNRSDLSLKQLIMDSIFGKFEDDSFDGDEEKESIRLPSRLLELILTENADNSAGPLFIYKILSNPLLLTINDDVSRKSSFEMNSSSRNARYQTFIVSQIRRILLELNINNLQPYKKLMDEVGLSSNRLNRSTSVGSRRNKRMNGRGGKNTQGTSPQAIHQMPPYAGSSGPGGPGGAGGPNEFQYGAQQFHPHMAQQGYPIMGGPQGMMPPQNVMMGQQAGGGQGNYGGVPNMQVQPQSQPQSQAQQLYQQQQDIAVMQQLEQLSLSSAALGYNSNPGTPGVTSSQRNLF